MKVEELNISEKCIKQLKRTGVTEIEEFIHFLINVTGNASYTTTLKSECFDEIVNRLVDLGLLSKEDNWKPPQDM